jgi:protein required for attachment to host cells
MKPKTTWILVADASRARIFENRGPGRDVFQLPGGVLEAPTANEYSDQPGRSFSSVGSGRSAMEPHHSKAGPAADFAAELMARMEKEHDERKYDRLIVCAPPAMLGTLREAVPERLRPHIMAEVDKDLTKVPTDEIAGHLEEVIAL